jgi:hypothetical protein
MNDNATNPPLVPAAALPGNGVWHNRLDRAGATASLLCAIHCLLAPFLAATAAAGALIFFHRELEAFFVLSSLLVGAWSLGWGYRHHKKALVPALFVLAAAAFSVALLPGHGVVHGGAELAGMITGGLALAAGHLLNRRYLTAH